MNPLGRLTRMTKSFAKNFSIFKEDYDYFITPDVPIPQSKAERKSGELSDKLSLKRNGKKSSGKNDG